MNLDDVVKQIAALRDPIARAKALDRVPLALRPAVNARVGEIIRAACTRKA